MEPESLLEQGPQPQGVAEVSHRVSSPFFPSPRTYPSLENRRNPQHSHTFYSLSVKKNIPRSTGLHNEGHTWRGEGAMLENELGGPPLPPRPPPAGLHTPGASTKQEGPDTLGSPVLRPHSGKGKRKPWKFQKENPRFSWDFSIAGFELYGFQKSWIKYVRNVFLPPQWSLKSAQKASPRVDLQEILVAFANFYVKILTVSAYYPT